MTTDRSKAALTHESRLFTVDTLNMLGKKVRTFVFRTDEAARTFKTNQRKLGIKTTRIAPAAWGPEA